MPCRFAISSHSLGRARHHSFAHKMAMAAAYGIQGIELFYEDLETLARSLPGGLTPSNQLKAACYIRRICAQHGLAIICLQPFMHYEGLRDRARHAARLDEMRLWLRLAAALGTDLICVPSSFLPPEQASGDRDLIVADVRELADMGLRQRRVVRFAYESLAWGTYADTWEASWEVVRRVDRPNFGLVLDTFNIAARVYADPASPAGKNADADRAIENSIERLVSAVDVNKVFLVQLVDAERLSSPLISGHEFYVEGQPPRMSWSRNCRLFYGELDRDAYLPIKKIASAIFQGLRYEGWVSAELFNRCMADKDPEVPESLARRAAISWRRLLADCNVGDTCLKDGHLEVVNGRIDGHL